MRTLLDAVVRRRPGAAQRQPACFSLVDFGSDSVKAVVVRKERGGVRVLGYGFAPAEGYRLGGGRADQAALAAIADQALVAAEDQTEAGGQSKVVPDETLFCIPASLSRGELFAVRSSRINANVPIAPRELKTGWERLERLARERLPGPGDQGAAWKPLALAPGIITLDGHQVSDPVGLKGRELWLSAFGVAVSPAALQAAQAIARRLELALINVVAAPNALGNLAPHRNAILIDIGAQGTSLQVVQHDALLASAWWPQGGEFFTQSLGRAFRCSLQEAEALKRAYAEGAVSARDQDLVAHALVGPVTAWLESLVARLRRVSSVQPGPGAGQARFDTAATDALPGHIYLTGGGSRLPDVGQALRGLETAPFLTFRRALEIEPLELKLGLRTPGRPALLDVPAPPAGDLLAAALGLATCLE